MFCVSLFRQISLKTCCENTQQSDVDVKNEAGWLKQVVTIKKLIVNDWKNHRQISGQRKESFIVSRERRT